MKSKVISLIVFCLALLNVPLLVFSQEINFGSYSSAYSASVMNVGASSLNFGTEYIFPGSPPRSIDINTGMAFQITGNKYLDVIVTINPGVGSATHLENQSTCTVNCTIPFTLYAAYSNQGANNTAQAVDVPLTDNLGTAQFQIRRRNIGAPPGPPPTPVYEGYNPALYEDDAYFYIYASLDDLSGPFTSGTYSTTLTINVTYD